MDKIMIAGLCMFVLTVLVNVAGLIYDLYLFWSGQLTITQKVWEHPILGVPIILLQVIGLVGLLLHFYHR
jgi:hypothetical protein